MVRANGRIPYRIYRPGAVVGHSKTGFIDKIDGPYYFFKALQKLRESWRRWMPLVGVEGGYLSLVPVDYVVDAMVYLAHAKGLDGRCFHLTDRRCGASAGVEHLRACAHAPEMAFRLDSKIFDMVPDEFASPSSAPGRSRTSRPGVARPAGAEERAAVHQLPDTLRLDRNAEGAREGAHPCAAARDYAWRLWDYWERHLDPTSLDRSLRGAVRGKVVVVTGGSSGIGEAAAIRIAKPAARSSWWRVTRRSSRGQEKIQDAGGFAKTYSCDITDLAANDKLAKDILKEFGHVDVLVNNAGRSIRRSLALSYDASTTSSARCS